VVSLLLNDKVTVSTGMGSLEVDPFLLFGFTFVAHTITLSSWIMKICGKWLLVICWLAV
jgi:hypothetical protein